jgi:hypothetical protein
LKGVIPKEKEEDKKLASTNKTPHLGLNQWVLEDPFLMEDMNEDNRRIDEAFQGQMDVKLIDVTTMVPTSALELDLSSIDLTEFAELRVCRRDGPSFGIRLNKRTDMYQYYNSAGNWQDHAASISAELHQAVFLLSTTDCYVRTWRRLYSAKTPIGASELKTIDFTGSLPAGEKITVWGVKVW